MKDQFDHIAREVIGILAYQAVMEPAEVRYDATLESLGLDSLGVVEVIFAIEERFDVSVPFNANEPGAAQAQGIDLSTVASVIEAVRGLLGKTG